MSSEEIERVRAEARAAEAALLKAMSEGGGMSFGFNSPAARATVAPAAASKATTSEVDNGSTFYNSPKLSFVGGPPPSAAAAAAAASSDGAASDGRKSLSKSGILMLDSDDEDEDEDEDEEEDEEEGEEKAEDDKDQGKEDDQTDDDDDDEASTTKDEAPASQTKKKQEAENDDADEPAAAAAAAEADQEEDDGARNTTVMADQLEDLYTQFASRTQYRLAQNAVVSHSIRDVALNHSVVQANDFAFSVNVHVSAGVTHQHASGRCWLFAALNMLRLGTIKKLGVSDFEFSQNHLFFWDKFERSNYFLEAIINTAKLPVTDREVAFLLDQPLSDGGQWNMVAALIKKHGLVPKSAMPETYSSKHSRDMNSHLNARLREGAKVLRSLIIRGSDEEELQDAKHEILSTIWRMLNIHLGTPPKKIDWQWQDKEHKFHKDGVLTPVEFGHKYAGADPQDYVCLVHDPRKTSPVNRTYTVKHLGNVLGEPPVKYLNVDISVIKDCARKALEAGEPVWFGCDFGKMVKRDLGLCDKNLFDLDGVYDTKFTLSKEDRLVYHESKMTHAMAFTGVDIADGKTRKWKVENSWGSSDVGNKGYWAMTDSWFDEHVFEIAARKSFLSKELQAALATEPIVLPPWDPMGALATDEAML
ncbi:bleomycin hydrolase [Capsaspora owczarzaki ATCC 30864]|uniref:bleomycin hydrolase n=1 Tax=Capsaspora owczarzaki (strain ATCC 30864) TaxID=595528 RepID=A0A0D2UD16_CAPO3|nr:bleomycin hydrolase [Capsaspora owczarzaki ATCC 30864]KJE92956.1 bleomycin hydrolase [Capsaspora owczarzaki ATCC 30864]|eukprot:XP_004363556.2 bleomycin hydrolase [Capsaspora owczarzaki ATCC 30864]